MLQKAHKHCCLSSNKLRGKNDPDLKIRVSWGLLPAPWAHPAPTLFYSRLKHGWVFEERWGRMDGGAGWCQGHRASKPPLALPSHRFGALSLRVSLNCQCHWARDMAPVSKHNTHFGKITHDWITTFYSLYFFNRGWVFGKIKYYQ